MIWFHYKIIVFYSNDTFAKERIHRINTSSLLVTRSYNLTSEPHSLTFDPLAHFKEGVHEKNHHNRPDCPDAISSVGDRRTVEYYFASDARWEVSVCFVVILRPYHQILFGHFMSLKSRRAVWSPLQSPADISVHHKSHVSVSSGPTVPSLNTPTRCCTWRMMTLPWSPMGSCPSTG